MNKVVRMNLQPYRSKGFFVSLRAIAQIEVSSGLDEKDQSGSLGAIVVLSQDELPTMNARWPLNPE